MVDKLGRNYILTIDTADGDIVIIKPPFTIEMDITRNTQFSQNVCQIRIYNLSLVNRNQLRFNAANYGELRGIVLQAGYGANLATIFTGNVSQAWSTREGTNFITQIECFDGGFAFVNGVANITFPSGVKRQAVIKQLAASLPGVTLGAVGAYPGVLTRGNSYSGNTAHILNELTSGGFFIDNGKAHALDISEYIAAPTQSITLINAKTGLLGTPQLEETVARFDMVFEPGLNPGQLVLLNSLTDNNYSGKYKIIGVKHRGMISDAVCGAVTTTASFVYDKLLTPAAEATH